MNQMVALDIGMKSRADPDNHRSLASDQGLTIRLHWFGEKAIEWRGMPGSLAGSHTSSAGL